MLHEVLSIMGHAPVFLVFCLVWKLAGTSRYNPPPGGGPGGDLGMGKTTRKMFKRFVNPAGADEDEKRERRWY
jgi:hypothetical protein